MAGGADRVAIDSGIELVRRGHRVRFLCAEAEADPALAAAGLEVRALGLRSIYDSPDRRTRLFGNPDSPGRVLAALDGLDPQRTLAHVHTFGLAMTWTAIKALQQWGARTVLTTHEYAAACPTANWFDYPSERTCTRKPLGLRCLACECTGTNRKARLPRILHFGAARRAGIHACHAAAIYVSETARAVTIETGSDLLRAPIQRLVQNPQNVEKLSAVKPSGNQAFTFVGRLVPEKGARAFLLAARAAEVPARIVGGGPLEEDLRREFPEAEWRGWLSHEGVIDALRTSRAYVFPSLWRETLGLSAFDAAAQGVPSLAATGTGAHDWIIDHNAGRSILMDREGGLADALAAFRDDTLVDKLGANAYTAFWASPPTLGAHVDALEIIYTEVAALAATG